MRLSTSAGWLVVWLLLGATAYGQRQTRQPQIGYLYPSGGRQGTTVQVVVGGQRIQRATEVMVTGKGVRGSVIKCYRPVRNLMREQRELLRETLASLYIERLAEFRGLDKSEIEELKAERRRATNTSDKSNKEQSEPVVLPEHPLIRDLEKKDLWELADVGKILLDFMDRRKQQPNAQIAEMVLIELTVDTDAEPGDRELRLLTREGLTNPLLLQVGILPEVLELEPNGTKEPSLPRIFQNLPDRPSLELPVLINGRIRPGDVDRFRFRARRGDSLVIEARARHLIPFLADAVPGWFQATLSLYDDSGSEIAFADDYRFAPDPVLHYRIRKSGEYELEIRDAIFRGREDFVYRISVSKRPFITNIFPLGGRVGVPTLTELTGWNLKAVSVPLGTESAIVPVRYAPVKLNDRPQKQPSNQIVYAVDDLPECLEIEPNDIYEQAQPVELPILVNGKIQQPGDVDYFSFEGKEGDELAVEVMGRRLLSPIDSLLRLVGPDGKVVAWNDDHQDKQGHLHRDMGALTHQADSYIFCRLPTDGRYAVQITDAQHQGSEAFGYRLRISPPRPDFSLRATPSSLNIRAGTAAVLTLYALRKDNYQGPIDVSLVDPPEGITLDGGRIPAESDRIRMTLSVTDAKAFAQSPGVPFVIKLQGQAQVDGHLIVRHVVPSKDMMQAFLYRHLTPSKELVVAVMGKQLSPRIRFAKDEKLQIPVGGTAEVQIDGVGPAFLRNIKLQLREPPDGISLVGVSRIKGRVMLHFMADPRKVHVGFEDNLIVDVSRKNNQASIGVLPSIPIQIVPK